MDFRTWYRENERRFHCGHMDTYEIAHAAWTTAKEQSVDLLAACEGAVIEIANMAMLVDPKETQEYMKIVYAAIRKAKEAR